MLSAAYGSLLLKVKLSMDYYIYLPRRFIIPSIRLSNIRSDKILRRKSIGLAPEPAEYLVFGFIVHTTPGRHFSGRGLKRNLSIWSAFVLQTPSIRLFLGGDSGYDTHFKTIGDTYGPFDLVILECGQYNAYWKYIHMMPEETVQAAIDLKAKKLLPVHWAKFALALHAWDDSITRVVAEAEKKHMPLIHPMIGQAVDLKSGAVYDKWWEGVL
jgi:L-ascorbate metabolism protein UlaG (beta-lactamase superfamily)